MKLKKTSKSDFYALFISFIHEMRNGNKLKKDGKMIREGSIQNFELVYKLLIKFKEQRNFEIELPIVTGNIDHNYLKAKQYWKNFYIEFTDFLYTDMNCFDNYVGQTIRTLRTFFNYLVNDLNFNIGNFHKSFYIPKEEIAIIALSPEQMNYIICNKELNGRLPEHLIKIKDMFIFGCTVCLRVSDLLTIKYDNIYTEHTGTYLRLFSQKTNTFTSVKLPDYAIEIIEKYRGERETIFPPLSKGRFNIALKQLGKFLNYDRPIIKMREKRGIKQVIYKDRTSLTHHTLADLITTHTMRRTGITTLLRLGVPDYLVRKISGHAPNSKEFFKYVHLAQNFLDEQTDMAFDKLKKIA